MALAESETPGSAVKLRRAPTLVAVTALRSGEEAQDREDLLATAVAAYIVLLGAHARGLAAYWRSVPLLDDAPRPHAAADRAGGDARRPALPGRGGPGAARARARPRRGLRVRTRLMARPAAVAALFPPPGDRHGPLVPMMVALTLLTGVVDAASYLKLGHVFVANMTGNVVFVGFAIAGAPGLSVVSSLIALAAFLLGARTGGAIGVRLGAHRGHLVRGAGSVQSVLIAVALVVALRRGHTARGGRPLRDHRRAGCGHGDPERNRAAARGARADDDRAHADPGRACRGGRRGRRNAPAPSPRPCSRCCSARCSARCSRSKSRSPPRSAWRWRSRLAPP